MLIAQGATQMKTQSTSGTISSAQRTCEVQQECDKIFESLNDLDSAVIEGTELEMINL